MKILSPFKYQMRDSFKTLFYYYMLLALVAIINIITLAVFTGGSVSYSYEMSTMIMMFVFGLCTFTEPFKMLIQNGISRRSFFLSRVLSMLATVLIATVIEQLLYVVCFYIGERFPEFVVMRMFSYGDHSKFLLSFADMILTFGMYAALYSLGSVTNLVFYRLGKLGRALVGAGVPIFFFIVLPVLDTTVLSGTLFATLVKCLQLIVKTGLSLGTTFAVVTVVAMGLSWLLMRRAVIKD